MPGRANTRLAGKPTSSKALRTSLFRLAAVSMSPAPNSILLQHQTPQHSLDVHHHSGRALI